MRRVDVALTAALLPLAAATGAPAAPSDEPALRYSAPIRIEQPAPFVRLPLAPAALAHAQAPGLADLRIVDARGERVPFALLTPPAQAFEQTRDARLYALPPLPAGTTDGAALSIDIVGDRIRVQRNGVALPAGAQPPGWLVDLGTGPAPAALRFAWPAGAEFSAGFRYELSDDLRQWRSGGAGQLLALNAPGGALTQPTLPLNAGPARYLRLWWSDPASAPRLSGATALTSRIESGDPPAAWRAEAQRSNDGALECDLGAPLALASLQVELAGTAVLPLRVYGRERVSEPWRDLGGTVFYRVERDGAANTAPPFAVDATVRWLRLAPDPRSPAPARLPLALQVKLPSVVFASQGTPPFMLRAGAPQAAPGALPATTLVPDLEHERSRFGRATLGDWSEDAAVARAEGLRAWRPALLWALLLAGVGGLGALVWRLARAQRTS
jgi:hypothetical protein